MSLRRLVRKLKLRWLAGLVGGFAFACSGRPANPEVAPLAPRPEPMQPVPGQPNPKAPVPGSPDPLPAPPDGAPVTDLPAPQFHSSGTEPDAGSAGDAVEVGAEPDGGSVPSDAVELPPIPDSLPADANKQPESPAFPCC
jgi:hypothetical protein